jgi:hypothetical protein
MIAPWRSSRQKGIFLLCVAKRASSFFTRLGRFCGFLEVRIRGRSPGADFVHLLARASFDAGPFGIDAGIETGFHFFFAFPACDSAIATACFWDLTTGPPLPE